MIIYKSLERLAGEKFPDNICEILTAAGYDSKTAIKSFSNPQTFQTIENYVNENPLKFNDILKGTKYEHLTPFKFLPGHIALLSGLPEYTVKLQTKKHVKVKYINSLSEKSQKIDQPSDNQNSELNSEPDTNIQEKLFFDRNS